MACEINQNYVHPQIPWSTVPDTLARSVQPLNFADSTIMQWRARARPWRQIPALSQGNMEGEGDGCFGVDQVLVGDLSGFHPDSVNLFNDQMEIAGECSVEDRIP